MKVEEFMRMVENFLEDVGLHRFYIGVQTNLELQKEVRREFERNCTRVAEAAYRLYKGMKEDYEKNADAIRMFGSVDPEDAIETAEILILEVAIATLCEKLAMKFDENKVFLAQARVMKKFLDFKRQEVI
ncbi:hypothetical protein DRP04_09190 [Archaeoglobales archaeon]|nr:MAG: hypothetical protein DRP04_09190 [Archaeoglobales archaeon]